MKRLSKQGKPPRSAADPRPGNRPYYISPHCPKCGTPLVLADLLENPGAPEEEIWHDEFICPACNDGIFMDWPEKEYERLKEVAREDIIPLSSLKRRPGYEM